MKDPRVAAYLTFVEECKEDLERIAAYTRKEFSVDDVKGEAWIVADALAKKQGEEITTVFTDLRKLLLAHLCNHVVNFREKKLRKAVRLDAREADEPDRYETLVGPATSEYSDPSSAAETPPPENDDPGHGTVAGGYLYLLRKTDGSKRALAECLMISYSYLNICFARALRLAKKQDCLFPELPHREGQPLRGWRTYRISRACKRPKAMDGPSQEMALM